MFEAWVAAHKSVMDRTRRELAQEPLNYTPIVADAGPILQGVGPGVRVYRDGVSTLRRGVVVPPNGDGDTVQFVYDSRTGRRVPEEEWW